MRPIPVPMRSHVSGSGVTTEVALNVSVPVPMFPYPGPKYGEKVIVWRRRPVVAIPLTVPENGAFNTPTIPLPLL